MKKIATIATALTLSLSLNMAGAQDQPTRTPSPTVVTKKDAPRGIMQLTALWPEVKGNSSFPWMETGKNPSGGELMFAYRWNISDEVVLLEWQFISLGGSSKTPSGTSDTSLEAHIDSSIGPTVRVYYGVLSAEAGVSVGPRAIVYGYIPGDMDENSNGYGLASYGIAGETFLRLGVGPVFLGGSFGLSNSIGGRPGDLESAINVDVENRDIDTSNVGKVDRVDDTTTLSATLTVGLYL